MNGGQLSTAGDYQWEVVYSPNDIHIFAYDSRRQPVTVQGLIGEMLMRVRGVDQEFKYSLGYCYEAGEICVIHDCMHSFMPFLNDRDFLYPWKGSFVDEPKHFRLVMQRLNALGVPWTFELT